MSKKRIATIVNELKETLQDYDENIDVLDEIGVLLDNQSLIASDDRERFRAVVDNVLDGIITIDKIGIVRSFNRAAEKLFGYTASEVIGQNVKMLMPEPYYSEHDGYLNNYKHSGIEKIIGIGREVTGLRKNGTTFPLDLAVSKINLGKELMFAGILRDITEERLRQEELEDSQERLQSILDSVYEGIITIEPKGIIGSFNRAAEKIFAYEASEVIGRNVKILMPEPYHSEHDDYLNNYMQSGIAKIIGIGREVEGRKKDGSTFPLFLAVTQIRDNKKPIFVGMVRDLSEQKRLEKLKNEFVSTVSHELRTPLTSIRGSLSLIESGTMGEVAEKAKPLIQIAMNNSERLILLINDILDIEKIESGKMDFELDKVELNSLIRQSVEANSGYAKEYNVLLSFMELEEPVYVYIDTNRMQQVLTNLISNAVKYSPKEDSVTIDLTFDKKRAFVKVHDNGLGIPESFKKSIFQKFAQADSSDTKQKGGTGLGLNISKAIVEKFGGEMGFLSSKAEGTTFFFDLPVIHNVKTFEEGILNFKGKVLIVEDDHDIATLLSIMLKKENIECDIAYTADEARSLLKSQKYDALTLDIMLPDQNGLSFLEEIQQNELLKDIPVIIVSSNAKTEESRNSNKTLEVVDWINKPIDQDKLVDSLNRVIEINQSRKQRILHVEDDQDIAKLVQILLDDSVDIDLAENKSLALKKLENNVYDLILLDMMLPDGSAEEILPYIKNNFASTPIVLFSAQEVDQNLKNKVSKALVKSRTSNTLLVETIKKLIS